jgi:hypothetical protein
MTDMWTYRETAWAANRDLVGFDVEATDGSIGSVDEATYDASAAYLVVDTGFWIFGKKRLIPAGAVVGVDRDTKTVQVAMTKDQIKAAPDYDSDDWDDSVRLRYGEYYRSYVR